jgi:hypothetical protein
VDAFRAGGTGRERLALELRVSSWLSANANICSQLNIHALAKPETFMEYPDVVAVEWFSDGFFCSSVPMFAPAVGDVIKKCNRGSSHGEA